MLFGSAPWDDLSSYENLLEKASKTDEKYLTDRIAAMGRTISPESLELLVATLQPDMVKRISPQALYKRYVTDAVKS
jgi:hypothetical protein